MDDTLLLYQKALHLLNEGIQIYDRNANIVYFNETSKRIVGMDNESFEGKNLLEVFDVTEKESTTIEALRLNAPVRNRFHRYYSKKGKELITINTSLPLRHEGELIGALTLEENVAVVQKKAERLEHLRKIIEEKLSESSFYHPASAYTLDHFIGTHPAIQNLRKAAQEQAYADSPLLITGETGTGKTTLAQAIHNANPQKEGAFIILNCSTVPEDRIDTILFGTEKEVFTGQIDRKGLLEEADNGTLLLSAIDGLPFAAQLKLLGFLQKGSFRRAGGYKKRTSHIRFIASTAKNTEELSAQLHPDLLSLLSKEHLHIPPLRDRLEDIEVLLLHHLSQKKQHYAFPLSTVDTDTILLMQQYNWPGNVRELYLAADYAMNVAEDTIFRPDYLPPHLFPVHQTTPSIAPAPAISEDTLQEQMERFEKKILTDTLMNYQGNISQAAKALGIQRQSLQYRIRKYNISL